MIRRIHALTNTFSGVAGEARIAAEMVRCGLRVAKPYWTDDEVDLVVLYHEDKVVLPIPIQVKSVQFLKSTRPRPAEGLKKRYVENNDALCLALYRPDSDAIWFIDGAENIRAVYDQGRPRKLYRDLDDDDDVPVRVSYDKCRLDTAWLVPPKDARWLPSRVERIGRKIIQQHREIDQISRLLDVELADDDAE